MRDSERAPRTPTRRVPPLPAGLRLSSSGGSRLAALCILLCGALAGCGTPADGPAQLDSLVTALQRQWDTEDEAPRTALLGRIGRLGRAYPDAVVPELVTRLRSERADAQFNYLELEIDYSASKLDRVARKQDAKRVRDVIYARIREHLPPMQAQGDFRNVDDAGIARMRLRIVRSFQDAEREEQRLKLLLDLATRPGRLDFARVVEPPSEGATPPSLWKGTKATYEAFIAKFKPELDAAAGAGRHATAGEGVFRLVTQRPKQSGTAPPALVVELSGDAATRFTQEDVDVRGKLDPKTGMLVLELDVKPDRREAFDAWCAANPGRRVALLIDNQAELVLPMPRDAAQMRFLSLGPKDDSGARIMLRYFVSAVGPGHLARPVSGKVVHSDPTVMRTPLSAALIEVGQAADAAVSELLEEGGTLSRRARWIREQIRKRTREAAE